MEALILILGFSFTGTYLLKAFDEWLRGDT